MGETLPFVSRDNLLAIVDRDAAVQDSLSRLLKMEGFVPRAFGDGGAFLEALPTFTPACVILDLHVPGKSGLAVLNQLADTRFAPPVLVVSGQPDVAMAVEAMKLGARDFFEKPFPADVTIQRVRDVVTAYQQGAAGHVDGLADFRGRDLLTRRERDVLMLVANGASNKEAGRRLGISPRTIEVHRARIMVKLGARNAADLMRIVLSAIPSQAVARAI